MDLQAFSSGLGGSFAEAGSAMAQDRTERLAAAGKMNDILMSQLAAQARQQELGISRQQVTQQGWRPLSETPVSVPDPTTPGKTKLVRPFGNMFTGETRQFDFTGLPLDTYQGRLQAYQTILNELFPDLAKTGKEPEIWQRDIALRGAGFQLPPWQISGPAGSGPTRGGDEFMPVPMAKQQGLNIQMANGQPAPDNTYVSFKRDIWGNIVKGSAVAGVLPPAGWAPTTAMTMPIVTGPGGQQYQVPTPVTTTKQVPGGAGNAGPGGAAPSGAKGGTSPSTPSGGATPGAAGPGAPPGARPVGERPLVISQGAKQQISSLDSAEGILKTIAPQIHDLSLLPNANSLTEMAKMRKNWLLYSAGKDISDPEFRELIPSLAQVRLLLTQPYLHNIRNINWIEQIGRHIPDPSKDTPALMETKIRNLGVNLPILRQAVYNNENPQLWAQRVLGPTGISATMGNTTVNSTGQTSSTFDIDASHVLNYASQQKISYEQAAQQLAAAASKKYGRAITTQPNPAARVQ
jgi:hypothetical protein